VHCEPLLIVSGRESAVRVGGQWTKGERERVDEPVAFECVVNVCHLGVHAKDDALPPGLSTGTLCGCCAPTAYPVWLCNLLDGSERAVTAAPAAKARCCIGAGGVEGAAGGVRAVE